MESTLDWVKLNPAKMVYTIVVCWVPPWTLIGDQRRFSGIGLLTDNDIHHVIHHNTTIWSNQYKKKNKPLQHVLHTTGNRPCVLSVVACERRMNNGSSPHVIIFERRLKCGPPAHRNIILFLRTGIFAYFPSCIVVMQISHFPPHTLNSANRCTVTFRCPCIMQPKSKNERYVAPKGTGHTVSERY